MKSKSVKVKYRFAEINIEQVVRDAILGCYAHDLYSLRNNPDEELVAYVWRKVRWANEWLVRNGYEPQDTEGLGEDEE